MRGLLVTALFVVGGMLMSAGDAQCAEEPLPLEVKKLIGMKIPAKAPGRAGSVPGWKLVGSYPLVGRGDMGVDELFKDNTSIFAIILRDEKDSSQIILDARVLPRDSLPYFVKNGKFIPRYSKQTLYFKSMCERADAEIIVGLMTPLKSSSDCTHRSNQVKHAWLIDSRTGRISAVSGQGVSCYWETEYACQ
jgi:hypothetical protein